MTDLEREAKDALGVGDDAALRALGTVFRAVRMTMNTQEFQVIQDALPEVETWLKAAPIGGGRTAEMLAIVGPEALATSLRELGLKDAQAEKLYRLVGSRLSDVAPEAAARVSQKLPALGR